MEKQIPRRGEVCEPEISFSCLKGALISHPPRSTPPLFSHPQDALITWMNGKLKEVNFQGMEMQNYGRMPPPHGDTLFGPFAKKHRAPVAGMVGGGGASDETLPQIIFPDVAAGLFSITLMLSLAKRGFWLYFWPFFFFHPCLYNIT